MNEAERNHKRLATSLKRKESLKIKSDQTCDADHERNRDFLWIADNQATLVAFAARKFEELGKGAVFVSDTGSGVIPPMSYITASDIPKDDEDTQRMVRNYSPEENEFVIAMRKPGRHLNSYHVGNSSKTRRARPTIQ